jgi:tRNA A-37 threonylcarbamoyl transferase component Bud32
MEYADGGSLRSYLRNHFTDLTWDDKYNLACQLVDAVSFLHNEGIIHRDLVTQFFFCLFEHIYDIYVILMHIIYIAFWQCIS